MFLVYIIPYLLLFFAIVLYHNSHPNNTKGLCRLTFWLVAVFSGISYDVGWDYLVYTEDMMWGTIQRYELLERYLLQLSINLGFYQLFFIVNHIAITLFIILGVSRLDDEDKYVAIVAYLCLPFMYLISLSTIRAALSMSLMFFAYMFFLKRDKIVFFLLCVVVSFFIHNVSILALLFIPLKYVKTGRIFNIALLTLSFIVAGTNQIVDIPFLSSFSALEDTNSRYQYYVKVGGEVGGQSMIHYFFLLVTIINILYYKRIVNDNPGADKYVLFVNVGYCLHLIFQFNTVFSSRFSRIFYVFVIAIIPQYVRVFKENSKQLTRSLIVVFCLLLFVYQLSLPNYNGSDPSRISTYWPYRVFLFS